MARSKTRKDWNAPLLPFEPVTEGQRDQVRQAIRKAIQKSGRSVEQIADSLSFRLCTKVSHHLLYGFTSDSHRTHRFPVEWVAAFCRETRDTGLLDLQAQAIGLRLVDADLAGFAEQKIRAELHAAEADVLKVRALRKGLI